MAGLPKRAMELMLAGWGKSHSGGVKVTFWLPDEEDLAYFEAATVRKGKHAGQRYMAALVEIGDDEQPVQGSDQPLTTEEQKPFQLDPKSLEMKAKLESMPIAGTKPGRQKSHFPDGLCGLAVKWCDDDHFQAWLFETFPKALAPSELPSDAKDNETAKLLLCKLLGIKSRKEIDTDPAAEEQFRTLILEPYKKQRAEDGADERHF